MVAVVAPAVMVVVVEIAYRLTLDCQGFGKSVLYHLAVGLQKPVVPLTTLQEASLKLGFFGVEAGRAESVA